MRLSAIPFRLAGAVRFATPEPIVLGSASLPIAAVEPVALTLPAAYEFRTEQAIVIGEEQES